MAPIQGCTHCQSYIVSTSKSEWQQSGFFVADLLEIKFRHELIALSGVVLPQTVYLET